MRILLVLMACAVGCATASIPDGPDLSEGACAELTAAVNYTPLGRCVIKVDKPWRATVRHRRIDDHHLNVLAVELHDESGAILWRFDDAGDTVCVWAACTW